MLVNLLKFVSLPYKVSKLFTWLIFVIILISVQISIFVFSFYSIGFLLTCLKSLYINSISLMFFIFHLSFSKYYLRRVSINNCTLHIVFIILWRIHNLFQKLRSSCIGVPREWFSFMIILRSFIWWFLLLIFLR